MDKLQPSFVPVPNTNRDPCFSSSQRQTAHPRSVQMSGYSHQCADLPDLVITCFGRFEIRRNGQILPLCPNRNAQTILRYLVAQTNHSAPAEHLLEIVWPDDEPEVARNKLHIAISALRRSLHADLPRTPGCAYLVYDQQVYALNPAVRICTDVEEFVYYYQQGQQNEAERVACYERSCQLYTGPFLSEDLYADWAFLWREQFQYMFFTMCRVLAAEYLQQQRYDVAAHWVMSSLAWDACDETAHRLLMQIYAEQGYRSKAIQQYQHCERILQRELGVQPMPATVEMLQSLLHGQSFT